MKKKQKVFVGISGGVDSSVAAYLLKQQGYDVHGIFVKTWTPDWLPCTWLSEKRDAMRVCATLDIPFHFLDASEEYRRGVAEYMIGEYRAGRTPNPDVLCNRVIKFGAMWQYAQAHGASAIATGHYAHTDGTSLYSGADSAKDQSYFLWMLHKDELAHVLFPIGNMHKTAVRDIAARAKLHTASKKDSQGVCFLGEIDMREFLSHYIEEKKGNVVTPSGEVIGTHEGAWFYTLGERHGFTITKKTPHDTPYYVVGKNLSQNELVVANESQVQHEREEQKLTLRDANWLETIIDGKQYAAQFRYHGEKVPVTLTSNKVVAQTKRALPLGQSLVVYEGNKLIGGGIIDKVE